MVGLGVFLGPLVGMVGGAITQWTAYKSKEIDLEDRRDQRLHERQMSTLQANQAAQAAAQAAANLMNQTALENEGALDLSRQQGDNAINAGVTSNIGEILRRMPNVDPVTSEDSTAMRWYKSLLGGVQAMVRVVVTGYLVYMFTGLVNVFIEKLVASDVQLSQDLVDEVIRMSIYGFIELTLTSTAFWFGGRSAYLKPQSFNESSSGKRRTNNKDGIDNNFGL